MKLSILKKSAWIGKRESKTQSTPEKAGKHLLDASVLNQIGHLELLTQRVVDGFISGNHRSTQKGGCCEFAQHRPYTAGDEIRLIDWHVFAKSDRYYIKQFEEETSLQVMMVVDSSGSMKFGHSTVSKYNFARIAAACLSRLVLKQRDSAGLALIDENLRQFIPPRSAANHLKSLLDILTKNSTSGETRLSVALKEIGRRMKRRGLVILFSDCFEEIDPLTTALQHLRLRGHEVILFHTLAPEEVHFEFNEYSRFQCLEEEQLVLDVDPLSIRKGYLERVQNFLKQLETNCNELGVEYYQLLTDQKLGEVLAHYLTRRNSRIKQ